MPKIDKVLSMSISVEQFLNNCNPMELRELDVLLSGTYYQQRMCYEVCRVCGCTDDNCTGCIEATGEACHWVEDDLCSRCANEIKLIEDNKL